MNTPDSLSARLKTEGDKVLSFFYDLMAEQWQTAVYTEETTWTVRSVLAHFVTTERGFLQLFENIKSGGSGIPEDFSIDRFNANQQEKVKELAPEQLVAAFQESRQALCNWVAALPMEDLEKEGRHPFLGQVSLKEMVKMVYLHNQLHLRDIRKATSNRTRA